MTGPRFSLDMPARRSVLRVVAATGLGVLLSRDGAPSQAGSDKKDKKKPKARCKKCPDSCTFIFHEAGGAKFCGVGSTVAQGPCQPCTSSSDCTDAAFPQCITDFSFISSGQRQQLGVCRPYTNGLCSAVFACRT